MNLFMGGNFKLHSGGRSSFKIDCDALSLDDIRVLALQIASQYRFKEVVSVPRGGDRLADALKKYAIPQLTLPVLIVDDVFTTGSSIDKVRNRLDWADKDNAIGVVIFSRGPTPRWVHALFTSWEASS